MYVKICISVTSHDLDPSPRHKLSHLLGPPPPLERDVLYGRPLLSNYTLDEKKEYSNKLMNKFCYLGNIITTDAKFKRN